MSELETLKSAVEHLERQINESSERIRKLEVGVRGLEEQGARLANKLTVWAAQEQLDKRRG